MTIKYMALNSDNNFLQSDIWRKFQEAAGCRTFFIENESFSASIIEHKLPLVGKYFYIPRWPSAKQFSPPAGGFNELIELARKNNASWIRIDPENDQILKLIKNNVSLPIRKAPHDMQPRENLVIDIAKSEDELLAAMKSKTRYNIRLAEKKGVRVFSISNSPNYLITNKIPNEIQNTNGKNIDYYADKFIELINFTAKRKGIEFHPENYYRKMLETIPDNMLKLYVADYNNKIIAANLVVFYGDTATYLHGATDDKYRNVMAPYLLQWQAIKDAKNNGYKFYDFGGVKTEDRDSKFNPPSSGQNSGDWFGITKFKLGFAPKTEPVRFPGSFDLVINAPKYFIYQIASRLINIFSSLSR